MIAEDRIQAAIVDYIRLVAPQTVLFAIPNGGLRTKREGAKLKWTGVLAGIPDLAIIMAKGRVAFIEVKVPVNSLDPEQRAYRDWFIKNDVPFAVCRSVNDARRFVADLSINTREAVPA